jgi:hypothetical protein
MDHVYLICADLSCLVCFAFVDNKDYQRRKALEAFADGTYRQDIVANNLNGWIVHGSFYCICTL